MATNWHECVCDSDYEISDEYPYPIKRKGSDKIIADTINNVSGYVRCQMNGKLYYKHRIVATQFIPNDDPVNKTEVDHINGNRADNHISNLRWTTHRQNMMNTGGRGNVQYTFLDELPETAEPLDSYGSHDLDGIFVDSENEKVYIYNGVRYRELVPTRIRGNIYYQTYDIENKKCMMSHKVLFG